VTPSGSRTPLAVRLYAQVTRLLPSEPGGGYADDATTLFEELHADAVRQHGWIAGWTLWARSTALLIVCVIRERSETGGGTGRGRGGDPMGTVVQDIRYGVRTLAKRPAFAMTTIVILGVGIGATTAIFSVVDTVVLRPLPYPDAGGLVRFTRGSHSYPAFRAWLAMSSFESLAATRDYDVALTGGGTPLRLRAVAVSPDFFRMFGGAPHLGRLFDSGDYPGDRSVAVLDPGLWQRYWGGDPGVVGRTIVVDGKPAVVIGVLDPRFRTPEIETGNQVDIWLALDDGGVSANDHDYHELGVVGRLAPGVSLEVAQAEVDAQQQAFAERFPSDYVTRAGVIAEVPLVLLREATVRQVSSTLLTLLGAVGLLLLIACANVANLFLAHGTARTREMSLRAALGATRVRLAGQVLTESVLLALAGGALAVVLAFGGVELFARFSPGEIPRIDTLAVDVRALAFSALIATLTGILFGVLPAVQAMRADVNDALKDRSQAFTASRGGRRLRSGLVVAEIALAMVLVTGAALLMRSFVARVQVDPGFDTAGLVVVPLRLGAEDDDPGAASSWTGAERLQFIEGLLERARALPGTRSAAAAWTTPFRTTGGGRCCTIARIVGDPALVDEARPFRMVIHPVTPDYFGTLGAPLASGREFTAADRDAEVAVVNRPTARLLFGREDVVGRTLTVGESGSLTLEIVGVAEGVHHWGPTEGVEEAVYVPYARLGTRFDELEVLVRTDSDTETAAAALRDAIWALDASLPVPEVTTMERRISASAATPRFLTALLVGFGAGALLLACGGIYGSMLYTVGQRRREMGIRLALGAAGTDVVRLVLRYGVALAVAGVALGTLAGLSISRVMEGLLWGIEPTDPSTFAAVAVSLGSAAVGAALMPAWRAGRTDPVQTLKAE
jgi:predicted permease